MALSLLFSYLFIILFIFSFVTIFFSNNWFALLLSFNIETSIFKSFFFDSTLFSSFSSFSVSTITDLIKSGFLSIINSVLYVFLNKLVYIVVIFFLCVKVKLSLSSYKDIIAEENSLLPNKFLSLFTSLVNNVKESKL